MSSIGNLWYTLGIKDLTDADMQRINKKLQDAGSTITVNPVLGKEVKDILPKWVDVEIRPNQVAQEALDKAIGGKALNAEILPLADKLKSAVADTLKDLQIPLNGLTIPPEKISAAVAGVLASANFTSVGEKAGDELAKAIKVKVEGQTYQATVTAKTDKLTTMVNDALKKIFDKEQKLKLDRSDIRTLRDELRKAISENVKVTPTLNVTQEALQKAVEGKVMRVEIVPLATNLRTAIRNAFNGNPAEIEVAPMQAKLRNLINNVLQKQGYMVNISTVTGLEKSITTQLNGRVYNVRIRANATEIANSVQASLMQVQSRNFGLTVSRDILRNSIDQALMGKPFNIQIAVMHDQARRAVQNALNNARMVGKDDALAYQRLQTGELRAAQAELARLKAAQQGAASAAQTHASASINLGGALGSNIKIAGELGSAMASLYSIHAAKQFLSQVIEIGGELEHQKIALETIYGSGSKMESLYSQIKGLARQSPFGVMELTKNIKQLSAYGVAYNEVYDTAKRLADISAATSVDIQRLILAFGKTKNRTFLDGLEAKQFAYANIPIYDMLSKKLTELEGKFVSVKDVMGRIKKREIGFDMVKDILWDMTDEGGKFYNMQEKLAGSVKTSWKLVRDNIELMFGEIAESGVGDFLKYVAEILQKLTREWKTLSTAVLAGGGAFAVYKLAVMGTNAVLDKHTGSIAANYLAEKQTQAAKLKSIGLTSTLSAREKELIATRKQLTATDLEYLFVEKDLDNAEVKRLYLSGKISRAELQRAISLGVLNQKQFEAIAGTKAYEGALLRLSATIKGTWATMKAGVASAFGLIFNWTTVAFAAIAGVVYLFERNSEEMKKAEEISDGLFRKATDSAKEMKDILQSIGSSDSLSNLELSQGIEQMESKIKDLSPTPIEDINNSLVAQDGHVRTLTERFDFLKGRLEEVGKAYESLSDGKMSEAIEGALKATDGGNWFTRLFNDNLETNGKDYTNALKRRADNIAEYASKHLEAVKKTVDGIADKDKAFANSIANMENYEQKLGALIDFENGKYAELLVSDKRLATIGNTGQIKDAYDELLSDTDAFITDMESRLRSMGWNPELVTSEQKTQLQISLKSILEQMEGLGDDAKAVIAKKWEEAWGVVLMEDKIGPAMSAKFKTLMEQSSDSAMEGIRKKVVYEGFDKLDKESQKKVMDLMKNAQSTVMSELALTNKEMSEYLASHPIEQLIQLVYSDSKNAPSELAKELVAKHGYPGLTNSTDRLVKQWTKSGKMYDARNAAKESLQSVYSELEAAKREGGEVQKRAQEAYDEVWSALQYLGWTDLEVKDQKSNKHTGTKSKKDEVAESLKQRFKDIKDAWSEFQKWSKTEGREAAAVRIGESGLFSTLPKEQIPKTVKEYRTLVAGLEDELRKAGIKGHSQRESLLNELLKQLLDIDKTEVDERMKLALEKVSREAERQVADWNLFDRIRKATGNQELAMSIAFGMNADAVTDYPAMIRKQFADSAKELGYDLTFDNTTLEQAQNLGDEIAKIYQDTASKLEKYAREQKDAVESILSEYQSLTDKLAKIDTDRERKIKTVNDSDMSDTDKSKYIQRINVEADYKKFEQSNEYLRFFNDIYGLTMTEANRIGDLIQLNLNKKLQAGLISIYDYEQQMEKVRKQLEALRNVKSNALTFMTGGVKGLNEKRLKVEEGNLANNEDYQKALAAQVSAQEALNKAKEEGNEKDIKSAEEALRLANESLKTYTAVRDAIIKDQEKWQDVTDVANIAANIAGGMSDAFNTLRDMADSFGFDTDSNAWNTAEAVMDTLTTVTGGIQKVLQSAMSGDIGGMLSGVFDTLLTPFTIWNKLHDRKLQKDIERSQKQQAGYERMINAIERRMTNFLGNPKYSGAFADAPASSGGAYGAQRDLMQSQLAEMERQKADMEAMKKKDPEAIADLADQIDEMQVKIREFAMEVAKDLYGIDLKDWASQLGDALFEAWQKGEDGAEAFKKKAGDILGDVMNQILKIKLLEPMMQDVSDYLFGNDGKSGAFGSDFELTPDEVDGLAREVMKGMEGVDAYNSALDELEKVLNEKYGLSMKGDGGEKSGLSAGIQSITEDTADLLASYVNAIRASVARMEGNGIDSTEYLRSVTEELIPQLSVVSESQLRMQEQIAANTLRNAIAAEAIMKSNEEINRLLNRATQGGVAFYVH